MRLFKASCLPHLLLLLLSFGLLSATSPTPDAADLHADDVQGEARLMLRPLTRNLHIAPKRSPVARALYELPNGWIGRVDKFLSLLPVQIATSVLESFYNNVIDNVRQKWIQQQPVNSFTVTWENIELEFSSTTNTIPWSFVLAFAQRLLHLTQRGFAGKYDIYFVHLPTGEEICVQLLIPLIAAGA